jgi:hypothetical protein
MSNGGIYEENLQVIIRRAFALAFPHKGKREFQHLIIKGDVGVEVSYAGGCVGIGIAYTAIIGDIGRVCAFIGIGGADVPGIGLIVIDNSPIALSGFPTLS